VGLMRESLSSQIDGATDTFTTSFVRVLGTVVVFYEGAQIETFTEPSASTLRLNFAPPLTVPGKRLFVEYESEQTVDGRVQGFSTDPSGQPSTPAGDLQTELDALSNRITALENAGAPPAATGGPAGGVLSGTYPNPGFAPAATLPPSGAAGGALRGTYPNPSIDPAALPTTLPPSGPAGGDLVGTFPNPTLRSGAIPTSLPPSGPAGGDLDGTFPNPRVRAGVVPTVPASLPPSGPAGGDLAGTFPNPTLRPGAVPASLPPSGPAGGDLVGTFPNPALRPGLIPTTLPPSGSAGGDLVGTYPSPTLRPGLIPTTLPPSGPAGGDLEGTYPSPQIAQKGAAVGDLMGFRSDGSWGPVPRSHQAEAIPSGPAGGDLAGTFPNPTIAQKGAADGEALTWDANAGAYLPKRAGFRIQFDFFSTILGNLVDNQTLFPLSLVPADATQIKFVINGVEYLEAEGWFRYDAGSNRIQFIPANFAIKTTDQPHLEYPV
jgi:hypothetical protein